MKKIISVIAALLMLFSLCSCGALEAVQSVALPTPETEIVTEPVIEESAPAMAEVTPAPAQTDPASRVIVRIAKTSEQFFDPAENTRLILDFSYETPHVDILQRDSAADAINEYAAMLDETYCTGNDYGAGAGVGLSMMQELAIDNFTYAYETGADINLELSSNRTVSIERSDDAVLSLVYSVYTYKGGDRGETDVRGYVFSTVDGKLLTLDDIAGDRAAFDKLILNAMTEQAKNDPALSSVDGIGEKLSGLLRDGAWYFNKDGLLFVSAEHELSEEIDGTRGFMIDYGDLAGVIKEKYIPVSYTGEGTVHVISHSEYEDGSMEVIDKVFADDGGEELCLVAEGTVYDVSLTRVGYTDYNGRFYTIQQLWSCSSMKDCVLQLCTRIPDGMPNLMLVYHTAAGETVSRLISQSGEDGSIILIEDGIVAVG